MKDQTEMLQDLRVLPCLSGLKEEDLALIGGMATIKRVPQKSILFLESEPVESFYIIRNGAVKLYKTSQEGRELIMKVMGEGDYFCCAPIYGDQKYYVNALTVEDSVLTSIPADDFRNLIMGGLSDMAKKMIAGLCSRIRFLSNLVEDLTFKDVEQRVLIALMRLADDKMADGSIVTLSYTHQDIASMIGTVREVVSRVMLKIKKEKIITESSIRGFKIDRGRLAAFLAKRQSQ